MPNIRRDDAGGHEEATSRRRRASSQRRDDENSDSRVRSARQQRDLTPHFVNPGLAFSGGRTGLTGGALSVQVVPDLDGDGDSGVDDGRKRLGADGGQSDPNDQGGRFITLNIGGSSRATSVAIADSPAASAAAVVQPAAATPARGGVAESPAEATATASAIALAPEQDPDDLPPTATGNSTISTPNNATITTSISATQTPLDSSSTVPAMPPPTTATAQPSGAAQNNGYLYLGKPDSKSMNIMGIAIGATSGLIILAIVAYLLIRRERRGQRRLPYLRPRLGNSPAAPRPNLGPASGPPSRPSSLWGGSDAGGATTKPVVAAGRPINPGGNKTNSAIMDDMMRAAYAAENGGNVLADAAQGGFPTAADEKRNFAAFPPEPRRKPRTISAWIRGLTAPRVGLPLPSVLGTWGGGGGGAIPSRPTSSAGLSSAPTLLTTSSDGSEYLERQRRQEEKELRQQRGRGRGRGRARERESVLSGLSDEGIDEPRPAAVRGGRR